MIESSKNAVLMTSKSNQCITRLSDLDKLRSAPKLNDDQSEEIKSELTLAMKQASWFTIGIMADSEEEALKALRCLEASFNWSPMQLVEHCQGQGPVFLKANQQSGDIRIRNELGLGEGILISGQHSDQDRAIQTWGPLPLNLFNQPK